ncbi:hypothetical protein Cni_G26880 [Canna indica]|uniref:Protein TIC 20 n=1 Tax=Canna indica TaxID=4628 RepID=A0AAQ3KZV0_9LILI|nr:hypothetical protein Cni_G26880 [Canna indica]
MVLAGTTGSWSIDIKAPCYLRHYSSPRHIPSICVYARSPKFRSQSIAHEERMIPPRRGHLQFSQVSSSFLSWQHNDALKLPSLARIEKTRARGTVMSAATKSLLTYPPMTSKPKWWWRTLACTPYLLPLHLTWLHANSAYHLEPLLQNWDFLVNPFLDTIALMPNWMMMVLVFSAYYLVVRRKEWPHFLRFHVILAMLLENGYQAIAIACTWLPNTLYRGKLGVNFWLAVTFAQLYTVMACMKCALDGKYADVPFVSDTAYIHSDLKMF